MTKPVCLFIGGFANSAELCQKFGDALAKKTDWRVQVITFKDALTDLESVAKHTEFDIVITHSASIFIVDDIKLKPKLLIAHAPPSNIRKRDFVYRYLSREAKRLFSSDGAFFSGRDVVITQSFKLFKQITEGKIEKLLNKQDNWRILSPAKDPLFKSQDYPVKLQNDPNFIVVEGSHDTFFKMPETVLDVIKDQFKS